MYKVAVFVGSPRATSSNLRLAQALEKLAAGKLSFHYVDIASLPHYDDTLWDNPPAEVVRMKREIVEADGVLFVTPEYNRSVPGCLKNALDVGSRPYGNSVWAGKPAAIMSVSPGAVGGFGANHHLRQSLVFLDMPILQQPEAYVGQAAKLFAEDGSLASEGTRTFFKSFIDAFAQLIERVRR